MASATFFLVLGLFFLVCAIYGIYYFIHPYNEDMFTAILTGFIVSVGIPGSLFFLKAGIKLMVKYCFSGGIIA